MRERAFRSLLRLASDLVANAWPDPVACAWLRRRGIDEKRFKARLGLIRKPVVFCDDGFDFTDLGEDAFVHLVRDPATDCLIDLVAWSAACPGRFAGWCGEAALMSGDGDWIFDQDPLPLWSSPFDYALAGCEGAVVIDLNLAAPLLKAYPRRLAVPSFAHAQELVGLGIPSSKILISKEHIAA